MRILVQSSIIAPLLLAWVTTTLTGIVDTASAINLVEETIAADAEESEPLCRFDDPRTPFPIGQRPDIPRSEYQLYACSYLDAVINQLSLAQYACCPREEEELSDRERLRRQRHCDTLERKKTYLHENIVPRCDAEMSCATIDSTFGFAAGADLLVHSILNLCTGERIDKVLYWFFEGEFEEY